MAQSESELQSPTNVANATPTPTASSATAQAATAVTTKTIMGKGFSVERYYMLSEIEQQALLPVYLNDHSYEGDADGDLHNNNNNNNNTDGNNSVSSESDNITAATVTTDADNDILHKCNLPPFVVLYLLWNKNNCSSSSSNESSSSSSSNRLLSHEEEAEAFRSGPLDRALRKLQSLVTRTDQAMPRVYVVVDVQINTRTQNAQNNDDANNDDGLDEHQDEDDRLRKERFQRHLRTVEALSKTILLPLRQTKDDENGDPTTTTTATTTATPPRSVSTIPLCGATVGLADHLRAAPGLESCLDAILFGAAIRRRIMAGSTKSYLYDYNNNNNYNNNGINENLNANSNASANALKSCVGIVCHCLGDLIGYDEEAETDAVQGVLQSLTHASWEAPTTTNTTTTSAEETTSASQSAASQSAKEIAATTTKETTTPYRSPILDYAHSAHKHWRVHKAGLSQEPTPDEYGANNGNSNSAFGSSSSSSQHEYEYKYEGLVKFGVVLVVLAAYWWKN